MSRFERYTESATPPKRRSWDLVDACILLGLSLVVAGLALTYLPVGLIVAGLAVVGLAILHGGDR